jgi:hypothetical protein
MTQPFNPKKAIKTTNRPVPIFEATFFMALVCDG